MIIGISGKLQSGKDTVIKMIRYRDDIAYPAISGITNHEWVIKRFADKLKDIVCMLTGCTREQLENEEFKNMNLDPRLWTRYSYAVGHLIEYRNGNDGERKMIEKQCDEELYKYERRVNWQTAYKHEFTYREVLQFIGTNLLREQFHENVWVNATMIDYKKDTETNQYPNWLIADVRFPNEAKAIKDNGGVIIRVERNNSSPQSTYVNTQSRIHPSETALDDYTEWDFIINNNGTLEDLSKEVERICIALNICRKL